MNQNNYGLLFVLFVLAVAGNWIMKSQRPLTAETSQDYKRWEPNIILEKPTAPEAPKKTGGIERLGLGDDPFGIRDKYTRLHTVPEELESLQKIIERQNDFSDPPDLERMMRMLSSNHSADPFTQIIQPVDSQMTSDYGTRSDPIRMEALQNHSGEDYSVPLNTEIPSPSDGVIDYAGERAGYGLSVEIKHSEKISSLFAHLNQIAVAVGQQVQKGQIIGKSGSSGRSTGPHLHYELRVDGKPVNPKILAMLLVMLSGKDGPGGF